MISKYIKYNTEMYVEGVFMVKYKVLRWQFSDYDSDDDKRLEDELNELSSDGWKIIDTISNAKRSGSFMVGHSEDFNRVIFILEKAIDK
jgi:hypothetical protein